MISPPLSGETTASSSSVRLGALSLALAGILLFLYPTLRSFSDQAGAQTMLGAQAFASPFRVVAHMLGVGGIPSKLCLPVDYLHLLLLLGRGQCWL